MSVCACVCVRVCVCVCACVCVCVCNLPTVYEKLRVGACYDEQDNIVQNSW